MLVYPALFRYSNERLHCVSDGTRHQKKKEENEGHHKKGKNSRTSEKDVGETAVLLGYSLNKPNVTVSVVKIKDISLTDDRFYNTGLETLPFSPNQDGLGPRNLLSLDFLKGCDVTTFYHPTRCPFVGNVKRSFSFGGNSGNWWRANASNGCDCTVFCSLASLCLSYATILLTCFLLTIIAVCAPGFTPSSDSACLPLC